MTLNDGTKFSEKKALRKARTYVKRGWVQGDYKITEERNNKPTVCFCVIGAAKQAVVDAGVDEFYGDGQAVEAIAKLLVAANPQIQRSGQGYTATESVIGWNDKKRRTQDQVLAAFDKALIPNKLASVKAKKKK